MAWAEPGQSQAPSGSFGPAQVLSQSWGFWAKPGRNITTDLQSRTRSIESENTYTRGKAIHKLVVVVHYSTV